MRKDFTLLLAFAALASGATYAAPLTPDEALARAYSGNSSTHKVAAPAMQMRLVKTLDKADQPTVYLFAREAGAGFVVTAANDAAPALLGYSNNTSVDVNNLPPAMQEWLASVSAQVAFLAERGATPSVRTDSRTPVSTLCATIWDQDAPFNNDCPSKKGQRCYVGCVATAGAQIMKRWNYPASGTGSNSGVSFNVNYDWANMLDSYLGSYTSEQAAAVALLCYHAGVAANMEYGTDGSGAYDYDMGLALIDNFKYDKGLRYLYGTSYSNEQWETILYDEMAAGRPVLLGGDNSSEEGHAFVVDGYDTGAYFHINWGWSGLCDGYYLLTDLDPNEQGIGGGSGTSGFIYNQDALINIKPDEGGNYVPLLIWEDTITTDKSVYNRATDEIDFTCGLYSMSFNTRDYTIGLAMVDPEGNLTGVIYLGDMEFEPMYTELSGFTTEASELPVGNYDLYPAYQDENDEWVICPSENLPCTGLRVYVTEDKVTTTSTDEPWDDRVCIYSGLLSTDTAISDGWTLDADADLSTGLSYVWSWRYTGSTYYLKGSSYVSSPYAATAYAISPEIDLSGYTDVTVTFDQAAKFQTNLTTDCKLLAREAGTTEWTALEIPTWPKAGSWSFVNSGEISLDSFKGEKIQLAFKYVGTKTQADTWEINNLYVRGLPQTTAVYDLNAEAIAPRVIATEGMLTIDLQGSEATAAVYDLTGLKVAEGRGNFSVRLPKGLYVVNFGGAAPARKALVP